MTPTTRSASRLALAVLLGLGLPAVIAMPVAAQNLRIGLQEDPDALDPHTARTYVGRIVFAALCDKLVDYDASLTYRGELASSWQWSADRKAITFRLREGVRFHDGEPFNAEAVRFNINRALTMPGTRRRSEIASVTSVDVVDPMTVRLNLRAPDAPLLSQLADRAGMMVSPKAAEAAGANFAARPVCSGPYSFVERVTQDRIVLDKFAGHWDAANHHVARVTYRPIPETTVRLSNLQAGALDMLERLAPNDLEAAKADRRLRVVEIVGLGYQGLTFNITNSPAADTPMGKDRRIRQAFELALDRAALNQVAFQGAHAVGNQPVPPGNPYYVRDLPPPARDVARARRLLQEAGVQIPFPVEMMVSNSTDAQAVAQIIQAMTKEAGFDVRLKTMEFASALQAQTNGQFQLFQVGWSGRADPDGNIHIFTHSRGTLNDGKYVNAEIDRLLDSARLTTETAERQAIYAQAMRIMLADLPRVYLWHPKWLYAHSTRLSGFVANPDGLIRLRGIRLQ